MRGLLIAWLLAATCSWNKQNAVDSSSASTVKETERNEAAGTSTTLETHTAAPTEIVTEKGKEKFGWVQPPEGSDAGVQWLPLERETTKRTAKIGEKKRQTQIDTGWQASGEGTKGAETALNVKATSSSVGEGGLGPGRGFWLLLALGACAVLGLAVWLFSRKWPDAKKPPEEPPGGKVP